MFPFLFYFLLVTLGLDELAVFGDLDFDPLAVGLLDVGAVAGFAVFRLLVDPGDSTARKIVLDGLLDGGWICCRLIV